MLILVELHYRKGQYSMGCTEQCKGLLGTKAGSGGFVLILRRKHCVYFWVITDHAIQEEYNFRNKSLNNSTTIGPYNANSLWAMPTSMYNIATWFVLDIFQV